MGPSFDYPLRGPEKQSAKWGLFYVLDSIMKKLEGDFFQIFQTGAFKS